MNREQEERFREFRKDDENYWDAMNDKSYGRCSEISKYMDKELRDGDVDSGIRKQYEDWRRNEEKRERAIDDKLVRPK